MLMRPAHSRSRPATARSSEVLPQPDQNADFAALQAERHGVNRGARCAGVVADFNAFEVEKHAPMIRSQLQIRIVRI